MNFGQPMQFAGTPQSNPTLYYQFYPGETVTCQQSSGSFTKPVTFPQQQQQQPITCTQPPMTFPQQPTPHIPQPISYTTHTVTYSQQPGTFPPQPQIYPPHIQQNLQYPQTGQHMPYSYVGGQTSMGKIGGETMTMQFMPTVKADLSASSVKDVYELKKAFDGIGCDSKVVNSILNYRSASQLQEICKEYEKLVGRPLWKRIRDELSDPHRYLMIIVVQPPLIAEAYMLNRASTGYDIDVDTVTYVLATHSDREISQIKEEHQKIYGKNIRDHLYDYSSGTCQNAWMALLEMRTTHDFDHETAHRQASLLYTPGKISEEIANQMIAIFCKSSHRSMIQVLREYERISGRKLYDIFVLSRPFERTIASIISYIEDPAKFFATYLREAITEQKLEKVINVISTHYQVDMGVISSTYLALYKTKLEDDITMNFKSKMLAVESLLAQLGL